MERLSLFANDVIFYIENLKDATLEATRPKKWIQSYCRMKKIWKSVAFLYAKNELLKEKRKKIIPFTVVSKNNKILQEKFDKKVKMVSRKLILMKENEEDSGES